MSEKIVQLNEEVIKGQLKELVRGSVEETPNGLLEAEAEKLTQAGRYERSEQRQGYRSGHYNRNLMTTAGEVKQSFCHAPAEISGCILSMWFLSGFLTQEWRRWKRRAKLHIPGCIYRFALGFCKNIKKRTETLYQSFSPFMAES